MFIIVACAYNFKLNDKKDNFGASAELECRALKSIKRNVSSRPAKVVKQIN